MVKLASPTSEIKHCSINLIYYITFLLISVLALFSKENKQLISDINNFLKEIKSLKARRSGSKVILYFVQWLSS